MRKNVRYYLYTLIMDGINEGMKNQNVNTKITNYKNLLANKIMKKHGIDMGLKWLLENPDYLDDWDNDLYSMAQIASVILDKSNEYVEKSSEYISKSDLKILMTSFLFDVNIELQRRNNNER